MYVVYAIYNSKHNKIYIGQTQDLEARLELHKAGTFSNSYTSRFDGEWKKIHQEVFKTRKEALIREKQLKSYQGRLFVKRLISPVAQR